MMKLKSKLYIKKLKILLKLIQDLEWTHPFPDGQGRTDLVLLSKLLCDQGFHPSILTAALSFLLFHIIRMDRLSYRRNEVMGDRKTK